MRACGDACRFTLPALVLTCVLGILGAPASAAEAPGTGWEAFPVVFPSHLAPGGSGVIELDIMNTGAKPSTGPVTVTDTLPAGVTAIKAGGMGVLPEKPAETYKFGGTQVLSSEEEEQRFGAARWACEGNGTGGQRFDGATVLTCTSNPAVLPSVPAQPHQAPYPGITAVAETLGIAVKVAEDLPSGTLQNHVSISGGGAAVRTSLAGPMTISAVEPGFGFSNLDLWFSNANGALDAQAGSHPYEATFALNFNELATDNTPAGGYVRSLEAALPPGFFGQPQVMPQCTRTQLDGKKCPADTQVGVLADEAVNTNGPEVHDGPSLLIEEPVYNMAPPPGVPDELGASVNGVAAFLDAGVSSANGYRIVEHIDNIPLAGDVHGSILTLWGVPAEASHDAERRSDPTCERGCSVSITPKPFLTLPTSCAGPQAFTITGQGTWTDPAASAEASVLTHDNNDTPVGFTGCEELSIEPSLAAVPDTSLADSPSGLNVTVNVSQENLTNPEGVVAATLKTAVVTLPQGLVINPEQAAGLEACGEAEANIHGEGPASCPPASKVGTVKVQTPLLEGELESELEGDVYVLQSNPPNLKLLIAFSGDGLYFKLSADVHLDEATGQVETTVAETPELPFTSFKLSFSGGAQAALATPTQCGTYTTSSDFIPWTSPFGADVLGTDGFVLTAGPGGSPCPSSPLPFSPQLTAGSTTDQAGGFTNFSLLLQRGDGQQRIDGLQFKAPQGLTGELANVPLCTNAQAEANACPEASKIGHTVVESGPGPYPLVVPEPGQPPASIYLTESYDGAPFGLSIVVPLHVGPFTLPTQRVRARIEVNPITSALTITTDPLPQEVAGVPTDLREIDSVIERPEFMVNPTNCDPQSFTGTALGAPPPGVGGAQSSAPIESHFQVGACRALGFAPKFSVSTNGKTSKSQGASLSVQVTYPTVPQGSDADIGKVKVELPEQLPSRLTTLQKACTARTFDQNPAACPSASFIGHAVVHTQLLPVPLEGPAIFVSRGDEAFPSLEIVLQGDGVEVILAGSTFISKAGITSTTFKTVPDDPFHTFELTLPQGPYSALAANVNLCAPTTTKTVRKQVTLSVRGHKKRVIRNVKQTVPVSLSMPNEFVGQNGAVIHRTTKITVTGCPTAKLTTRSDKHHPKRARKKK